MPTRRKKPSRANQKQKEPRDIDVSPSHLIESDVQDEIDRFHETRGVSVIDGQRAPLKPNELKVGVWDVASSSSDDEEDVLSDDEIATHEQFLSQLKRQKFVEKLAVSDQSDDEDQNDKPKSWGRRRKDYYGADIEDADEQTFTSDEDLGNAAELEAAEALETQKQLTGQLAEEDMVSQTLRNLIDAAKTAGKSHQTLSESSVHQLEEVVTRDLSALTKRERLEVLQRQNPEIFHLASELKTVVTQLRRVWLPLAQAVCRPSRNDSHTEERRYLDLSLSLRLGYCINIVCYFMFKSDGRTDVKSHPVIGRILQYKQAIDRLKKQDTILKPRLNFLLNLIQNNKELPLFSTKTQTNKRRTVNFEQNVDKVEESTEVLEVETDLLKRSKRPIDYEIASNKGLTPKRKKEQRNPRVKHRNKYKKAKIRRKGQIREYRGQDKPYMGEPSGIRTHVTRGIKLKA